MSVKPRKGLIIAKLHNQLQQLLLIPIARQISSFVGGTDNIRHARDNLITCFIFEVDAGPVANALGQDPRFDSVPCRITVIS